MWRDDAAVFAGALTALERPAPDMLAGDPARFAVYRNNIAMGLREVLTASYPVTNALVGDEFFAETVRAFCASEPPTSPVLAEYGAGLPTFIEGFPPAGSLPYLADVARLEWAWQEAYHAADADPADITAVARAGDADGLRFVLHPSVRLVRSEYPVVSIWHAHQGDAQDFSAIQPEAERALIVRPRLAVAVHALGADAFEMITMLAEGMPLGRLLDSFHLDYPETDASACLAALFDAGGVISVG
ncbi:MAG: DNA-binding domain-containing protein [Rhodospirillales bacterium]